MTRLRSIGHKDGQSPTFRTVESKCPARRGYDVIVLWKNQFLILPCRNQNIPRSGIKTTNQDPFATQRIRREIIKISRLTGLRHRDGYHENLIAACDNGGIRISRMAGLRLAGVHDIALEQALEDKRRN